jgi:hypothetical protein
MGGIDSRPEAALRGLKAGSGRVDPSQRHGDNNGSVKVLKARGDIEVTALFSG